MAELTPKQQEVMAKIEADLTAFGEEHMIGRPYSELELLRYHEEAMEQLMARAGMEEPHAKAQIVWRCELPIGPALEDEYEPYPICGWTVYKTRWRRLRMRLGFGPGRCPLHGTKLRDLIDITTSGRITLTSIHATIRVL